MTELIARARAQQDRDVTQARITFYRLLDSDDYDYLALEKTLTDGIEQLTSAERQDLAVLLAADLKVLRDRQATRAGAAQRKERDAMQDRIRKLEDQLHQEQQNDADQRITIYDQPYLWPVYINRPVYVPSEPCPAPVPSPWHQAFRPPTPAQPVAVPYSPRVTPLPVARPVPTPVCPAPAYQPDKPAPRTAWTPAAAAARPAPIIPAATRSPHTRGPVNIRR